MEGFYEKTKEKKIKKKLLFLPSDTFVISLSCDTDILYKYQAILFKIVVISVSSLNTNFYFNTKPHIFMKHVWSLINPQIFFFAVFCISFILTFSKKLFLCQSPYVYIFLL